MEIPLRLDSLMKINSKREFMPKSHGDILASTFTLRALALCLHDCMVSKSSGIMSLSTFDECYLFRDVIRHDWNSELTLGL
jgi:hypothetical protein